MDIGEKIKKLREAEGIPQFEFCVMTGVNIATLRNSEQGRRVINSKDLLKITQHPRLQKYALWLMTDLIAPESGQISPHVEELRKSETG